MDVRLEEYAAWVTDCQDQQRVDHSSIRVELKRLREQLAMNQEEMAAAQLGILKRLEVVEQRCASNADNIRTVDVATTGAVEREAAARGAAIGDLRASLTSCTRTAEQLESRITADILKCTERLDQLQKQAAAQKEELRAENRERVDRAMKQLHSSLQELSLKMVSRDEETKKTLEGVDGVLMQGVQPQLAEVERDLASSKMKWEQEAGYLRDAQKRVKQELKEWLDPRFGALEQRNTQERDRVDELHQHLRQLEKELKQLKQKEEGGRVVAGLDLVGGPGGRRALGPSVRNDQS